MRSCGAISRPLRPRRGIPVRTGSHVLWRGKCAAASAAGKTFVILGQPGGAASAAFPAGATDLAAREVSGTAEEVGAYVFATGTARLVVAADVLPDAPVTVRLWQVRETRENTMVATLDARHRSCIFTNLPPQTLYAVTVDGAPDVQLTVRSRLTFREAFSLMLQEL